MRVPLEWLQQIVDVRATAQEIAERLTMGGLEVEGIEPPKEVYQQAVKKQVEADIAQAAADLGDVLDVYITPNRGDCLSMVGVAREVAALYSLPLKIPLARTVGAGEGVRAENEAAQQTSVTIEDTDLCPRYAARIVRGVKVGPSPEWMQARLAAAGMRPINNIVDVTNYVLLELGQPLHAFDLDMLAEGRIVVRQARDGETLKTLDGEERSLTSPMLVIADAEKAVAIAGVMGGAETEVSEKTTNVLFESAHFHPLSVRRTSRGLNLRTEASYRFERVVDPNGVVRAVNRACQLLAEMGQPEAVPGVVDIYPKPIEPRVVNLRVGRAAALLGIEDITAEVATDCLTRLELSVQTVSPVSAHAESGALVADSSPETLAVTIPTFRPDLTIEEDLVEEVGRIYGYENIPETLPRGETTRGGESEEGQFLARIRQLLVGCGLQEVITHSLSAPSFFDAPDDAARRVAVRNVLSAEVSGLRRSLLPTLLDVAKHNATRGQSSLALFEIGRVWQNEETESGLVPKEYLAVAGLLVGNLTPSGWQKDVKPIPADFSTARGVVEQLCAGLDISEVTFTPLAEQAAALPQFHPGRTATLCLSDDQPEGVLGELHPRQAPVIGLRDRIILFEISLEALHKAAPSDVKTYRPVSRFPAVSRDLAPRVAEALSYSAVETAIQAASSDILEEVRLTDVFRGGPLPEGIKSLTLAFTFRSADRTLSEGEVNAALDRLRTALETECGATFP